MYTFEVVNKKSFLPVGVGWGWKPQLSQQNQRKLNSCAFYSENTERRTIATSACGKFDCQQKKLLFCTISSVNHRVLLSQALISCIIGEKLGPSLENTVHEYSHISSFESNHSLAISHKEGEVFLGNYFPITTGLCF